MDYLLSEEQEKLKETACQFLEKECPETVIRETREEDQGYSPQLWSKIADLKWLGLVFPEKYEGTDRSLLDLAVLYEEMGRVIFPSPHLSTVVLCGLTILSAGSEEQKAELLPRIAKGDLILALALAEPESSWDGNAWDAQGITVQAAADGDHYVINGTKLFVHDAHVADYVLCAARTKDSGQPEHGITLFLVDTKSPGVECTLLNTTAYDKPGEVVFNQVEVPKENIVGEVNKGWGPLARVLQIGAVMLCAQMVGSSQKALELAVDHAKTRIQFDMPIGINQYIQGHCIDVLWYTETSRWLTYQAAWKLSEELPCDMEVAMAKAWTSEAHEKACWHAHQVLAGVGYTSQKGVMTLYSMKGKTLQHYLGDTSFHLNKVAHEVEKWTAPEKPRGKPLGYWDIPAEEQIPAWEPWQELRKGKKTW
ncbi:MAG: acyl-CoA/acyl-ACP dehydrogenase [Deltaproteobacteria bacterium]|nr:acyl-CoA/acyl-ACP dehydrogenase [Deltaproteobacteria bacterium]MBW2086692.1 acyl-CoA/acyl-ACP dehydrogenase [Deltaproteobacteria bacterium]